MIRVKDLWVKYQHSNEWILKNINFEISAGEIVIIAGSSGCGKSTLARVLLRLIPNFYQASLKGEIFINGKNLSTMNREELVTIMGYVPQYPADYVVTLIVEEELAFLLENLGYKKELIDERITVILKALDIEHLRYRLLTELSSGELQRVTLAGALVTHPPILILDEPMARIDPKSEIALANVLKGLAINNNSTVVMFEHRLDYLLPIADRLFFMDKGTITAKGTFTEIASNFQGIDLPEVARISVDGKINNFIDVQEAISFLSHYFNDER